MLYAWRESQGGQRGAWHWVSVHSHVHSHTLTLTRGLAFPRPGDIYPREAGGGENEDRTKSGDSGLGEHAPPGGGVMRKRQESGGPDEGQVGRLSSAPVRCASLWSNNG